MSRLPPQPKPKQVERIIEAIKKSKRPVSILCTPLSSSSPVRLFMPEAAAWTHTKSYALWPIYWVFQ